MDDGIVAGWQGATIAGWPSSRNRRLAVEQKSITGAVSRQRLRPPRLAATHPAGQAWQDRAAAG
ncbi:MAG: hypothetical protein WCH13_12945, partial [Deltaproteobacteria bacterium]